MIEQINTVGVDFLCFFLITDLYFKTDPWLSVLALVKFSPATA